MQTIIKICEVESALQTQRHTRHMFLDWWRWTGQRSKKRHPTFFL